MGTSGSDSAATCPQTSCFLPLPLGLRHPRTPQGVPREGWGVGHGAQVNGAGGMGFSEKLIHTLGSKRDP